MNKHDGPSKITRCRGGKILDTRKVAKLLRGELTLKILPSTQEKFLAPKRHNKKNI